MTVPDDTYSYITATTLLCILDEKIGDIVSTDPGRPLVASHPVYQYLAHRYGLIVKSVHWEPDQVPNNEMWKELRDILSSHPAKWMIWEGPPIP